jgi:glycosyltransferase involved in cell wall biosynthesis
MKSSLIITTYNWPQALEACLNSLARQTALPSELVIADDGSAEKTAQVVARFARLELLPVRHVWQEDTGFRLARSRNRALAAARSEYIIVLDGDMLMHRHFIEDHLRAATRGCFIQGVRLLTGPTTTQRMLEGGLLDLPFLANDIERRRHLIRNRLLHWLTFRPRQGQRAIRGSNQAYWRDDLLRVNGWDERMVGWGKEDNEIAARMYHSGVMRRNLKFQALTIHLHHRLRSPEGVNPNEIYLEQTIASRRQRCDLGVDQYLEAFARELPADAIPPFSLSAA